MMSSFARLTTLGFLLSATASLWGCASEAEIDEPEAHSVEEALNRPPDPMMVFDITTRMDSYGLGSYLFYSANKDVTCMFSNEREVAKTVRCEWKSGRRKGATLSENRKAAIFNVQRDIRELSGVDEDDSGFQMVLPLGESIVYNDLICRYLRTGMWCWSTRTDRGFHVSAAGERTF
jgi:hypothetical protein